MQKPRVIASEGMAALLIGQLPTQKSESESVRRNSKTEMPQILRKLKVTWADILLGNS